MRKHPQKFSKNKQIVRDLQCETISKYLGNKLGRLSYFGLPSSSLEDVAQWNALLEHVTAVERGEPGKEWELQHDLEFNAFRLNLFNKLTLLRGEIDEILMTGQDSAGLILKYPFDIVSLDYSGGLFYKDLNGNMKRLEAIQSLFQRQSTSKADFVFLLSCNLDAIDQGEIARTLSNVQTALNRTGLNADQTITAYLKHPLDEARMKIYVPYLVNRFASKYHYNCETQDCIFYTGNLKTKMMAFRFYVSFDGRTVALRDPRERDSQIINAPMIEIIGGVQKRTTLDLPKLRKTSDMPTQLK